mmetsp:Transcript_8895/g.14864  ORF Transcript_8895/g.14864 Transcript_8895/m.14864 type:complete len:314 (-) Transcript_8895:607-1548(-)
MEASSDEDDEDGEEYDGDLAVEGEGMSIPHSVFRRLLKMKQLHEERAEILAAYHQERAELEARYRARYAPLYGKRGDLIAGRVDVPPEEFADAAGVADDEGNDVQGVPQFWLRSMLNHDNLAELVNSQDVSALEYLIDIQCHDKADLTGFVLEFHFAPNPFFKNSVLSKSYDMASIVDNAEPVLENVSGTAIQWKPEMDLCFHEVQAQSADRPGQTQARRVRRGSFFHFFGTPRMQADELTEDDLYTLTYEMDYEFALIFRNHLIPDGILWFTGEAMEDEDDDEDEGDEEGEDYDDEDELEDSDEPDDEAQEV